jgi:hypothetical protein
MLAGLDNPAATTVDKIPYSKNHYDRGYKKEKIPEPEE